MLRTSFRLPFRLAGIPLYLHFSFLLVLPLMALGAAQYLGEIIQRFGLNPEAVTQSNLLFLGLVAALGLFVCVVLHELGHSLAARRFNVKVRRITLWFLGGVAEFEEMPRQRGAEAIVGIAGPIVSFVLAAIFWGLVKFIVPTSAPSVWVVCFYLFTINLMLGLFNLLPALPMDGGRILRSLLALKMSHARATVVAGYVAKAIAIAMGLAGVLYFHNLWLVVLAFFIFTAVRSETTYSVITDLLRGVRVGDITNRDMRTLPAGMSVGELAHFIFTAGHNSFAVADDHGRIIGTIGPEQIQNVHPQTPIWQAMTSPIQAISEHADALDALARMNRGEAPRLMVVDDAGGMIGILSQADLLRAAQMRAAGFQTVSHQQPISAQPVIPPYAPAAPFGYTPGDAARDPQRYARPL
jgi:Zn-dependent protease